MDQRNRHEKEDSTAGDRLLWPRQRLWGHSPGRARMLNVTVACIVRDILKRQPGATSPASSQIFSEFVGTQPLRMPCLRSQGADKAGRCYLGSSSSISIAFSTTVAKTAWHCECKLPSASKSGPGQALQASDLGHLHRKP